MKAVLLAAGKSTRTYPLTLHRPKPLLPLLGKPLISYTIEGLQDEISEWVIITGYMEDMIQEYLQSTFPFLKFTFLSQEGMHGTGEALSMAKESLGDGTFIVLNGDDLYHPEDIKSMIKHEAPYMALGKEVENPSQFGVFRMDTAHQLLELVEKPKEFVSNFANIGAYKFDHRIFKYTLPLSPRGEYEIVDYINALIKDEHPVQVLKIDQYWLPITYPWDILKAQHYFLEKADIAYRVDPSSTIDATAFIGKNVYIGKNCTIGENVEIEHTCLMDNVHIEANSRIYGSVLGDSVVVKADSILDGSTTTDVELPISGKAPIKINPPYKGAFVADNLIVEGFHLSPVFICE